MKDNKRTQILLLVLVCLIWGTVVYRFMNFDNGPDFTDSPKNFINLEEVPIENSSFSLDLNYSDPFLKRSSPRKSSEVGLQTSPKRRRVTTKKIEKKIPNVVYSGYSTDNQKITRARVKIGDKTYTLKKNEAKEGVIINEIHKDSIAIFFKGEQIVVKRKN